MIKKVSRNSTRKLRHERVRKNVSGSAERPRMVIYRSLNHFYAQVVDDTQGHTLVAASSLDPSMKGQKMSLKEKAEKVGALIGVRSKEKGITAVVFDRGGYKYHGRVAALAEAARGQGLEF
jgi:large subunit ribosomal protein L18